MKLTAKIKLLPTDEQRELLLQTMEAANQAANYVSDVAWQERAFGRVPVHRLTYYAVRERFGLSAQMAVRVIGKVVDAYKLDRKTRRRFRKHGAISYDDRILKYNLKGQTVSIWTVGGRETIPFQAGERQLELLKTRRGESDLALVGGSFYLFATCDVETPDPIDVVDVLGVDLGIVNIAVDSDGNVHSGSHVKSLRHRHQRLRSRLQKRGTKSAKRKLKERSGKEQRFARDVNHCIARQLVSLAQRTKRAIALEELQGIRQRVRVRRNQRRQLHTWAFHDLQQKILYKAELAGVAVVFVDPAYTSQTCPICGCVDKRNRPAQSVFTCVGCGCAGRADAIAAVNVRRRAVVNLPNVSDAPPCVA